MAFVPRMSRPEAGNKYYITKSRGGYSDAIQGKPTDAACDVLSNCVGYAFGRFNEIGGYGYCKYLRPVNAENFMRYKGSLQVGQTPKLGACMVWQKGASQNGSDGAGHVAIVEKIINNTQIITSESGWGSSNPFWTQTRNKGNGNWGMNSAYHFLGFIYNPAVIDEDQNSKEENTMGNSPLATYTNRTNHHSGKRQHTVDTFTPHCVVGQWSAKQIADYFANTDREASCNYGIGKNGDISVSVDECNRSWCSSSRSNDNRAITVECASDTTHPYAMTNAVYESLINLCVDICKRYNKTKVIWLADKNKTMAYYSHIKSNEMIITVHRWFAAKACPGDWLYNRLGDFANRVNAKLGNSPVNPEKPSVPSDLQVGDTMKLKPGATYTSGKSVPNWVINSTLYVRQFYSNGDIVFSTLAQGAITGVVHPDQVVNNNPVQPPKPVKPSHPNKVEEGDVIKLKENATYLNGSDIPRWVINSTLYAREIRSNGDIVFSTLRQGAITGVVHPDQLESNSTIEKDEPYLVKVTASYLNIRRGPGVSYGRTGCIQDRGTYTIVETVGNWGKLKSGAGWICLDYTVKKTK